MCLWGEGGGALLRPPKQAVVQVLAAVLIGVIVAKEPDRVA
jgi:hypothetical protein